MVAYNTLTRFMAKLTGGENDLCNHAWFDMTPEDLKAELARLKDVFVTAMKTKKAQRFYEKNGYLSNDFFDGYNINLQCGDFSDASKDDEAALREDKWITFDPKRTYEYGEGEEPEQEDPETPLGVDPEGWDANIDDYALRMTKEGVYWIVESSWDEDDDKDETPVLPWDFIK